jgi:penicillin-binding protein 1A
MTPVIAIMRRLSSLFYLGLVLSGLAAVVAMGIFFMVISDLPRVPEPLNRIIETPPTEIFAATGERIMLLGGREAIPLNRISPFFVQAVIATEDHRFWDHHGVDKLRTFKALWITLFEPGKIQGASTITQQLAKNLFFSFRRTYMRKFRELLVALQIEARYRKQNILEAYLNQIPFGVGAYGIEQAARFFIGKPALELNLAEAALLAGLPKSPTHYNPYRYFERAKKRQKIVLSRMVAVGFITPREAQDAFQAELNLQPHTAESRIGSYFLDVVLNILEERYGPDVVYHGGLKVMTTLDPLQQALAVDSMQSGLAKLDQTLGIADDKEDSIRNPELHPQGALVAVQTNSGAVNALVGGRDYLETEYNRAIQNNRLPGSGFKPFVYYTAFEKLGFSPATVVVDKPVTIPVKGAPDWKPRNFSRNYEGPMILKRALMKSVNSIAAQLVERSGPQDVIETARRCGIESPLKPVYSVALGTSGVSPLEMASAFATFATGGIRHQPFLIRRVEDSLGRILEEHILGGQRVLDAAIAYQVVDMMRGVIDDGSGAVVRRLGFNLPAAGKTGTTDDYRDAWFTGFTPNLSVAVWVGFDRATGMRDTHNKGITGGKGAAPIWADFMIKATDGEPPRDFSIPADIRFEKVNPVSGAMAGAWTENPQRVALRPEQQASKGLSGQTPSTGTGFTEPESSEEISDQRSTSTGMTGQKPPAPIEKSSIVEEDLSPDR